MRARALKFTGLAALATGIALAFTPGAALASSVVPGGYCSSSEFGDQRRAPINGDSYTCGNHGRGNHWYGTIPGGPARPPTATRPASIIVPLTNCNRRDAGLRRLDDDGDRYICRQRTGSTHYRWRVPLS